MFNNGRLVVSGGHPERSERFHKCSGLYRLYPKAAVLLDVYHIYKGGGNYEAMRLLSQQALPVLHLNDFPANPPRETIKDADRVFPGDGIAPLDKILQMVDRNGGTILSLELFNRNYWAMPALEACRTGLMKSVAAVAHALS